jgi:SAM-dependent methyltransferase
MVQTLNDFYIRDFVRDVLAMDCPSSGFLLDLGCGCRPYRQLIMASRWRPIFVDHQAASEAGIIADARYLPFEHRSCECILCLEAIEHIEEYELAISEMARILKPGGMLAITWPFMYGLHDLPDDYNRFTEFYMEKILKRHGLSAVQLRRRGDSLGVLHTLLGQYGCGAAEALTRIPWVGSMLGPLRFAFTKLIWVTYWIHYMLSHRSARFKPSPPGDALGGISGALTLWTLGYCVVARKD